MMNPEDHVYAVICYIIENGQPGGSPVDNSKRPFMLQDARFDDYGVISWDYEGDNHEYGMICSVSYFDIDRRYHACTIEKSFSQILFEVSDMRGMTLI